MKSGQRDAGSLMITVIAMIFIVSIIIFAGSTLVISGSRNVHTVSDMKQAHYMAEAGIEDALSDPYLVKYTLENAYAPSEKIYELSSPSFPPLEPNKVEGYEVKAVYLGNKKIEIASTGRVKNQSGKTLAEQTITCQFEIKPGSFYDLALEAAIVSDSYLTLNNNVSILGSVIAQGDIDVNNNTTVKKDVITKGKINLNNNVTVDGKVISAKSYICINNNTKIMGDTVAYGTDNNGYAVRLGNNSIVHDIYTPQGTASQVEVKGLYDSIKPIEPTYPATYEVPQKILPTVDDEIKSSWIKQAQSDGVTYSNGLTVGNNKTFDIGNAFITGDLKLENNAKLKIYEGSVIYVTGNISIENNAEVIALELDGDPKTKLNSCLITNNTFDIKNNSIHKSVSLVALGTGTSYLKNNSATTGAILVPNGSLQMENNAVVHGGIFAKSIPGIGNNTEIHFDPLLNLGLPPTLIGDDALTLLKWMEE